jgi:hypothetical protein
MRGWPCFANSLANSRPMPLEEPVINTLFVFINQRTWGSKSRNTTVRPVIRQEGAERKIGDRELCRDRALPLGSFHGNGSSRKGKTDRGG